MRVAVLGAGIAGPAAALALARAGHQVTLVERDDVQVTDP
jgi:2-polyprenyl-6-methoxyphenol hydroxylase-like FAD-dependent oxidoreductase